MEYTIRLDPADGIFTVSHSGDFDIEGLTREAKDLISHPQWRPGSSCLLDYRPVNLLQIPTNTIHQCVDVLQRNDPRLGNSPLAIVVKDRGDFGIGRMFQIIAESRIFASIKVFTDLDAARKWLKSAGPSA